MLRSLLTTPFSVSIVFPLINTTMIHYELYFLPFWDEVPATSSFFLRVFHRRKSMTQKTMFQFDHRCASPLPISLSGSTKGKKFTYFHFNSIIFWWIKKKRSTIRPQTHNTYFWRHYVFNMQKYFCVTTHKNSSTQVVRVLFFFNGDHIEL